MVWSGVVTSTSVSILEGVSVPLSIEFNNTGITKLASAVESGKLTPRLELQDMHVSYPSLYLTSTSCKGK